MYPMGGQWMDSLGQKVRGGGAGGGGVAGTSGTTEDVQ